jgi:hypothetical protein
MFIWLNQLFNRWQRRRPARPSRKRATRRLHLEGLEDRCVPAVFMVTTAADSGVGSLRTAITSANASVGVQDTIQFAIGSGFQQIHVASALPIITDPVIIDATTQPGYAGTQIIDLDGTGSSITDGLQFGGGSGGTGFGTGSTVRGLAVTHFVNGIEVDSNWNVIAASSLALNTNGLYINNGNNNVVGTNNIVSSNSYYGIIIFGAGSTNNSVVGNFIGTDATGSSALNNGVDGIVVLNGATNNIIGGGGTGNRNIISGNSQAGVELNGNTASGNTVTGNYIGTNASGTAAIANGSFGVYINASNNNKIGGTGTGQGNLISGNGVYGVAVTNTGSSNNTVAGNLIGTNAAGTGAVGNGRAGVAIGTGAPTNNLIGGIQGAPQFNGRNVISGNALFGVEIAGAGVQANQIGGNYIGTDVTGMAALGNGYDGVLIYNGATNDVIGGKTIGGTFAPAGNIISGNGRNGVFIINPTTTQNSVAGNYIGLNANGTGAIPNKADGVQILNGAHDNTIGGIVTSANQAGNVISGNAAYGVEMSDAGTAGNLVQGNYIGTSAGGTAVVGNAAGVFIHGTASNNTIGGGVAGAGNSISGNSYGVILFDAGTTGNLVQSNFIGTTGDLNATGVGNVNDGVYIGGAATGNTIGGANAGTRNVISGNGGNGVTLTGSGTDANFVQGNYIGTTNTGTGAMGNAKAGVALLAGVKDNIIGGSMGLASNVISGNSIGVDINASGASGHNNLVQGNLIGTNAISNDVQTISTFGTPTGGTFTLTFNGQTATLPYNATAAQIQTALNGLSSINGIGGSVTVTGGPLPTNPVVVTFGGTLTGLQQNLLIVNSSGLAGGPPAPQVVVTHTRVGGQVNAAIGNGTGVLLENGATFNSIGGNGTGQGNVISGNFTSGVQMTGAATTQNLLLGNYVGTDGTGLNAIPNSGNGVLITGGAQVNTLGGIGRGMANVIAGNNMSGVLITGATTKNNLIEGDFIGNSAPRNDVQTLSISGNPNAGSFTLFFGNLQTGPIAFNATAAQVQAALVAILGNNNVAVTGGPLPSSPVVITFEGALASQPVPFLAVGNNGLNSGARPVIAHTVFGAQNIAVGNALDGVTISAGATGNTVGGNISTNVRNFISGNARAAVTITDAGSNSNVVEGNLIGTNAALNDVQTVAEFGNPTGGSFTLSGNVNATPFTTAAIPFNATASQVANAVAQAILTDGNPPNGFQAVDVFGEGGPLNVAPVTLTFQGSLANTPVQTLTVTNNLSGGTSPSVVVAHTVVGTPATAALANNDGVNVLNGAGNTQIGGTLATLTNVISGNNRFGILVSGAGASNTLIAKNLIGTLQNGTTPLTNGSHGIFITDNASNTIVGGINGFNTNANTIVAGTGARGVLIGDDPGQGFFRLAGVSNQVVGGNLISALPLVPIDLGPLDGYTFPNAVGHVGPNNYQNPVSITSVIPRGTDPTTSLETPPYTTPYSGIQVIGSLNSTPNTTFRLEFYYVTAANPSRPRYWSFEATPGVRSSDTGIYFTTVTTDGSGNATFTWEGMAGPPTQGDTFYVITTNLTSFDTSEATVQQIP